MADRQRISDLHLLKRRFAAWWEGEPFDLDSVRAEMDTHAPMETAPMPMQVERVLSPRLSALELVWGPGRLFPGDELDESMLAAEILAAGTEGPLLLLGPGLDAPVRGFASAEREIHVLEWRSEAIEILASRMIGSGFSVEAFDLERLRLDRSYGGAISMDCLIHTDDKVRFFARLARALPANAIYVANDYVGAPGKNIEAAFASAFAEPQPGSESDIRQIAESAGFETERVEDVGATVMQAARSGFIRVSENMESLSGALAGPIGVARTHEVAWEVEAWRARLELLGSGRIQARRFFFRRTATTSA